MALNSLLQGFFTSHPKHLPPNFPLKITTRNLDLTLNRRRDLPAPPPLKPASLFPYPPVKKYGSTCLQRLRLVGHKNFICHNKPVYNSHMYITEIFTGVF